MIAAELAVHLGSDLKLDSVGAVWDEIELLAPVFRGITQAVLDGRGTTDGVVAPLQASAVALGRKGSIRPLDPIAFPGLESVDRPGGPSRAGLAEVPSVGATTTSRTGAGSANEGSIRPGLLEGPVDLEVPRVGPSDSYSVRLVAARTLYDLGSAVSTVPALAGLVATAPLRVNQQDLDALGVPAGGSVRLRSASVSAIVSAVPDASLPRKVVAADFNVPMDEGTIADFIDTNGPVVELRMETP
jgi:predicted molibdopterin-dependent oxidoreductase YjgC